MKMKEFSEKYLNYLAGPLAGLNLTRITDSDEFYNKQILDSVLPLEKCPEFAKKIESTGTVVDIGFGGGIPILPLAYKMPEIKFFGFEARKKKVTAAEQIRDHLKIANASFLHQRFEEVLFDKSVVIIFRAVGKISDLLEKITTTVNVYVFFYKGPNYRELEDIKRVESNWELIEETFYEVNGTDGRYLVGFKNKARAKENIVELNKSFIKFTDIFKI